MNKSLGFLRKFTAFRSDYFRVLSNSCTHNIFVASSSCYAMVNTRASKKVECGQKSMSFYTPVLSDARQWSSKASDTKSYIIHVTDASFQKDVVENPLPVVLDCWAEWCGPCRMLNPILEKVVSLRSGKVILAKLDIDQNQDMAGKLGITAVPSVFFWYDGKVVNQFRGVQPEELIDDLVEEVVHLSGK